jgi:hypothetical protein
VAEVVDNSQGSGRGWRAGVAVLVAMAVVVGGLVVFRQWKSTGETQEAAPKVAELAGVAELYGVAGVFSPTITDIGSLPQGSSMPEGFVLATDYINVAIGSKPTGTFELRIKGKAPPPGAIPAILHLTPTGRWERDHTYYSDGAYVAPSVRSFSPRIGGYIRDLIDVGTDLLTGRTDPSQDCDPDPYGWVTTGSPPADGSFHVCLRKNAAPGGVERVEIEIKSNRGVAMWITLPTHARDFLWVEGDNTWSTVAPILNALDGDEDFDRVLLGPGRRLTVGYTRPVGAGPRLDFSSYQNNYSQLASLAYAFFGDVGADIALLSAFRCVIDASSEAGRFVPLGEIEFKEVLGCMLGLADVLRPLLTSSREAAIAEYMHLVAKGRLQLSAGAVDGIGEMVDRAQRLRNSIDALEQALKALDAAVLLSFATSGFTDALLAFTPGLNMFTALLVGTGSTSPTTIPSPSSSTVALTTLPTPTTPPITSVVGIRIEVDSVIARLETIRSTPNVSLLRVVFKVSNLRDRSGQLFEVDRLEVGFLCAADKSIRSEYEPASQEKLELFPSEVGLFVSDDLYVRAEMMQCSDGSPTQVALGVPEEWLEGDVVIVSGGSPVSIEDFGMYVPLDVDLDSVLSQAGVTPCALTTLQGGCQP